MAKHIFTGIPFTPQEKCHNCEHLEQCHNANHLLTAKGIIIDCESFYYIFKELEKFEKMPILVEDIEKDRAAFHAYERKHGGIPYLVPPLVVNGALAVELALKFLIFKENGKFDCIHNLQYLFEQLPDCHKIPLTEMICKHAHQTEETLKILLPNISNLFEDFRYFFEKEHIAYTNFFNEFIHIVCDYAISQKPADEEDNENEI